MKSRIKYAVLNGCAALSRFAQKYRLALCMLLALALSGALGVYNIASGPLRNLNDIGGWGNRALFIAMTAAMHALVLAACALLSRVGFARTALRQLIVTAGLLILELAINQKGYAFVKVMLPVIRAMDAGGLSAGFALAQDVSAPMLTLCYLITRGPIYDMYMLKLFAMGAMLMISLLAMRLADRMKLGLRAEVLLALCMILPQGFLNAACSALPEVLVVLLLAAALTIESERSGSVFGAVLMGAACALCGAALYALPAYVYLARRGHARRALAIAAGTMLALCVPTVLSGVSAPAALGSLFAANLGLPAYANGAPTMLNLIPRAIVEHTPQYAPILRHMPELDLVTNAQEYYTQTHFISAARGLAFAGLAVYLGVLALAAQAKDKTPLHRALILTLGALLSCPNASSAIWLFADVLCLLAILSQPGLRLSACLVLFATMCTGAYPMTEETMLPMIYAFALCLAALCMLLDIIPTGAKAQSEGEKA